MPGVTKRLRIAVILSTSSTEIGFETGLKSIKSRKAIGGAERILALYCFQISYEARSQADCNICIVCASHACFSPDRRDL